MRKKHRRQLFIMALAYLFLGTNASLPNLHAAASGNYTDLLPVGAPANTTVISNGSGWSLTTLPPTTVWGDGLSRLVTTPYQVYVSSTISNTTLVSTFTALVGGTAVGSTTIPAAWVAAGRSIRVTVKGRYSNTSNPNWTWALKMSTTTILTTNAVASPVTQTGQWFSAVGLMTISTAGASGTMNATYEINVGSGTIGSLPNTISYSTTTAAAVPVDLTSQLTINPVFTWGTASTSNTITVINAMIELLN